MNANSESKIGSYSTVYAIGHRAIANIFTGEVEVTEKIDGSQFSMARIGGELFCRSKGQQLVVDAPDKMFTEAVSVAKSLPLHDGMTYRCEYLQRPRHNTLAYSRIPNNHLMVYGVDADNQNYMDHDWLVNECERLGLEPVPLLYRGVINSADMLKAMLDRESVLGGCKIEGVVVKNYAVFTPEKKVAVGKLVSDAFKEKHQHAWKQSNPTQADIVQHLISELKTEARWLKAVQHLRDAGKLTDSPQDIGPLIKEIQADTQKEECDAIKESLFKHFWPKIQRGIIAGFPEFYKARTSVDPFATKIEPVEVSQ